MTTFEPIQKLCTARGVSGREDEIRERVCELLSEFPYERDALGDLIFTVCEPKAGAKTIALEAHLDKIGMMVSSFTEDGFLHMAKVGGLDADCLMGSEVQISAKDGSVVRAAVGAPFPYPAAPHNSAPTKDYKMPKLDELFVETGFEKPSDKINIGAQICMPSRAFMLLSDVVAASALDDRVGCASLILAAAQLKSSGCENGVKLIFSSREETGGQGAGTAAFATEADYTIAVDAGFAISPDVEKKDGSEMGKGVEIDISSVLDERFTNEIIDCAEQNGVPYQLSVQPARATGTDADRISVAAAGRATALLSIPVRFMHHPVETAALCDIENTAKLLALVCGKER